MLRWPSRMQYCRGHTPRKVSQQPRRVDARRCGISKQPTCEWRRIEKSVNARQAL